jgi:uncharacterized protein
LDPTPPEPAAPGPSPAGLPEAPAPPAAGALRAAPSPALPQKSGLLFFGALLLLFGPGLVAQALHPAGGLAWTELFVFLVPSLAAAAGSNLRPVPYLGLRRPRLALVVLGALVGGAGFLAANAVMALWMRVIPLRWVEIFDVGKLFEVPLRDRIAIALVAAVVAPVCEEIAFRGYLQRSVVLRRGPAAGIAAAALLFATLHLDPVRFPALLLLGAVFGWISWRSGSTWPAIAAHAANNGIASAVVLSGVGADAGATLEPPPVGAILPSLLVGGFALGLLLRAFRNATRAAPPPDAGVVLRDPADPSTRFALARVPLPLRVMVALGLGLLPGLALLR